MDCCLTEASLQFDDRKSSTKVFLFSLVFLFVFCQVWLLAPSSQHLTLDIKWAPTEKKIKVISVPALSCVVTAWAKIWVVSGCAHGFHVGPMPIANMGFMQVYTGCGWGPTRQHDARPICVKSEPFFWPSWFQVGLSIGWHVGRAPYSLHTHGFSLGLDVHIYSDH